MPLVPLAVDEVAAVLGSAAESAQQQHAAIDQPAGSDAAVESEAWIYDKMQVDNVPLDASAP